MTTTIRAATADDCPMIANLIRQLAVYEKLEHAVTASLDDLRRGLFGDPPFAHAIIAQVGREVAGFALYFYNFSTFRGKPGLYLEDLFVKPEYRGRGVGKALLARLAKVAVSHDCGRFEWSVLDWNEPSIRFYKALGARPMDEWTMFRIEGEALDRLAQTDMDS